MTWAVKESLLVKRKVSAVQNANSPQSIAEIRSSLGLVQYCAKFLPGFPAQNADEKRPTVYVGRRPEEILPLMERSANPSRNTCLLQEWMQDSHCCWRWSHRHRSCPHIATRWLVESKFLCILTDVERSYSLALVLWHMYCGSACVSNHDLLLPHPLSPLPSEENFLVVVDYYSRFFEENIMRSTTSQKMIEALTPIFTRYGYPIPSVCVRGIWRLRSYTWHPTPEISTPLASS